MSKFQKIVHLTSAHPALDVRIFQKECRSLAEAGFDVHLVAPHDGDETIGGVKIHAVRPSLRRSARFTVTAWAVFRKALSLRADLYHFHDPELLVWALPLQWLSGSPVVYDSHEYLAVSVKEREWLPAPLARWLGPVVGLFERLVCRALGGVVTVNPHMRDLFAHVNRRVTVVANFPKLAFSPTIEVTPEPDSVIYVGVFSRLRGYELAVDTMRIVRQKRPSATFRILGEVQKFDLSPAFASLSNDDLRERGIEVLGKVPYRDVPAVIAAHGVGWIPWLPTPHNSLGTPTKLLEYMALGRPVVASDLTFVRQIVEKYDCGIVGPPSPEAQAEALLQLLDDPARAARLGENGRRAILGELNWESQFGNLYDLYAGLSEGLSER